MATMQIPRTQWTDFLNRLSRDHRGWCIRLEVLDAELGAQLESEGVPFEGAWLEVSQRSDEMEICLHSGERHVTHVVPHPIRIWHAKTDDGPEALEIEGANDLKTILRFRPPAPGSMTGDR